MRLGLTAVALALSWVVLSSSFQGLDRTAVVDAIRGMSDAERLALLMGGGLVIAAQGLVTSVTVRGLAVRRGVLAYLGPAAVASVIPGPSDLPVRYRMLATWGYEPSDRSLAVTASGVLSIGSKLVMPILALLVALATGIRLSDDLSTTVVVAGVVLAVLIGLTAAVIGSPRVTGFVSYWLQAPWSLMARLLRRSDRPLADVLERTRGDAGTLFQHQWPVALWSVALFTAAQVGLMIMAVRFMGIPDDALPPAAVFIAFGVVQGVTVLPITAGNVGVAETAWVGVMGALAGQEYVNQVTAAVLVYRVLTWLAIIPLGGIALLIWRVTTRRPVGPEPSPTIESSP